MSKWCCR